MGNILKCFFRYIIVYIFVNMPKSDRKRILKLKFSYIFHRIFCLHGHWTCKYIVPDFGIIVSSFIAIMTLMEPYTELDERAALVQIWSQLDYTPNFIFVLVKWLVSLGAIAALAASMFGSMFPMPRIAYAMAKDGLIFRFFASMNSRGVPACANFWLSITAALSALYFR